MLRREVHPLLGEDRSLLQQLLVDELRGAHPRHDVTGCALVRGQSRGQSLGSNKIGYIITINFSVIKQNMS